jgi:lipopolysaccharide export system permease protein
VRLQTLDRYLAREILLPFTAGLVFLTQLLIATQLLAQSEVLLGSGVSVLDVAWVAIALTPHFLGYVLPIAFLLGSVLGVGRLAEDREIIALGAAGVSPVRLARAPLLLGVAVSLVALFVALELEPAGLRSARKRLNDVIRRNLTNDVKGGVFFDEIPGLTVYVEDARDGGWHNVLISDRTDPRAPLLALARSGRLEPAGADESLRLFLDDGELHREEPGAGEYVRAQFGSASVTVAAGSSVSERNRLGSTRFELSSAEILARAAQHEAKGEKLQARRWRTFFHRRAAGPVVILAFALLAVPLAAVRRGGRAAGYVATLFAVVLYYALLRLGENVAHGGGLPVWLGPHAGSIVVAVVALALIWRLDRKGTGAVR